MNKFIKNVALYVLLIIIAVSIFNTFVHPQENIRKSPTVTLFHRWKRRMCPLW